MTSKDFYYNKAKQEGYRSRAAYKLIQLDEDEQLFSSGDTVVDLGAAPGGWMQVAAKRVGSGGRVIGADFQGIDPIEADAEVVSVRGDVTEESTMEDIVAHLPDEGADVVLSDMAPNMTGEYSLDQARSVHLASRAFDVASALLAPGGHFAVKVFQGSDVDGLRGRLEQHFEYVRTTSPDASRDSSSEVYLIGKRYLDPPVEVGDRVTVEITQMGTEGDGIASIEGYRIFVQGTEVGDEVDIEITDLKANFGFARRLGE